ncbi:MAG TPA: outer membrane lipoprotein carrier protein LolA [Planctomycetota bacterium]|nr:outer membrane lipoprotein carrier protein LolA [Planctomycetota bacterium]
MPELRPPVRAGPARVTAAIVAAAVVLSTARADESPLDALIAKVKKGMAGVKTTRGRFKQTKKLAAFDDTVESKGTFAIERPGKLRWEIESPFKSVLVIAGDKGARWNETRKKVERFALADKPGIDVAVKQMFSWYSGTFDEAKGSFDATVEKEGRAVSLVPKNEKVREVMARISIVFSPDWKTIESIALVEKGGDRTDIAFEGVELDKELPAKTFEIEEK